MLFNVCHKKTHKSGTIAVAAIFCFNLCIEAVTSLARVDNNWRPNATAAQNQWGQTAYRPAGGGGAAYQPSFAYNRNNQTLGQQQYQQPIAPGPSRSNQTLSNWYQADYGRNPLNQTRPIWPQQPPYSPYGAGAFNQTRPASPKPSVPKLPNQTPYPANVRPAGSQNSTFYTPQNPTYGHNLYNQSRPAWPKPSASHVTPQNPAYGQNFFNQSRPIWSQPSSPHQPYNQHNFASTIQNPTYGHNLYNQSRPAWPQPSASHVTPQNPANSQNLFNQSRPSWSQPSAPHQPYNQHNPASNLYPPLPNNPNIKPAIPPNSWTPSANQTLLYPELPNQNKPQPLPSGNNNGIPLAPLQPQINPQGPHNWHSGGQSALSYGPGYYPPPADNSKKTPPNRQGSSNPYANMFI